jgi:hypothetical protein
MGGESTVHSGIHSLTSARLSRITLDRWWDQVFEPEKNYGKYTIA